MKVSHLFFAAGMLVIGLLAHAGDVITFAGSANLKILKPMEISGERAGANYLGFEFQKGRRLNELRLDPSYDGADSECTFFLRQRAHEKRVVLAQDAPFSFDGTNDGRTYLFAILRVATVHQYTDRSPETTYDEAVLACIDPRNESSRQGFEIEAMNRAFGSWMTVTR